MAETPDPHPSIRLLLSDLDGTLLTPDVTVTERSREAVNRLKEKGIAFTVTSSRPPRGTLDVIRMLEVTLPIAVFNGGMIVRPDLSVIEQHVLTPQIVHGLIPVLQGDGLDVWLYTGEDWFVPDRHGPHVDKATESLGFEPKVLSSYDTLPGEIIKIVGYSGDHDRVARCKDRVQKRFPREVSASSSKPYYVDITHPAADKGAVVEWLSSHLRIPAEQVATIGDGPNDVMMFKKSGLSIAMGNADESVKKAARFTTRGNDEEGFAHALEEYLLQT